MYFFLKEYTIKFPKARGCEYLRTCARALTSSATKFRTKTKTYRRNNESEVKTDRIRFKKSVDFINTLFHKVM